MSRQNVNVNQKFTDSDGFMLTDIDTGKSLMLIPCDTAGNFSWTGVTRAPLQRNAMQTTTTNNQYSDLEKPWISIPQENWSGGRGNDIFTKDTTRYRDGKRAQAAFNEVIYNTPLDYYSTGFRKAETNYPGSMKWQKIGSGSTFYIAVAVTPSASFNAGELYIHLRRRGTPTTGLTVSLVNNLTASRTTYASHTYTTEEITDTLAEFVKFTFSNVSLTSGTTYYIIVSSAGATSESYWEVGTNATGTSITKKSTNGTNWTNAGYDLYYRIAEAQSGYVCKFFWYKQIMFMIRQLPNGTPKLYMNGLIAQASGGSANTISLSGAGWATDKWKGARIGIVYGHASEGHVSNWRTITGNNNFTITVDKDWDYTYPSNECQFLIVDTPIWTEVTGHGLTASVTDIHVVRDVVYFAQGDYVNARKMRWYNGSFQWQDMGLKACFFQSVRDSNGMMMYRGLNNYLNKYRMVDRARLLDWQSSATTWTTITDALTTKEPEDKSVSNTVVTVTHEPHPEETKTHSVTKEITDSSDNSVDTTVNATATTKLGDQTESIVTTETTQGQTESTSGTETTTTTTADTTKTVDERKIASPSSETINTTTETTIGDVTVTNTESVSNATSIATVISGYDKQTTTTKTSTTTTHIVGDLPLRTSILTESKDFGMADFDAKHYTVTIGNFTSDNNTGTLVVTLQESEDNVAFDSVQSVTCYGTGVWHIFAHCKYPYRRFIITATGTNTIVNNIAITTSSAFHFEDPVFLLDNFGKITKLFEYGAEMYKSLWIFQEGMVSSINKVDGTIDTYTLDKINLDELQTTADEWNGSAVNSTDVYLTFAWLNGWQRYYNTQLEGKGPDHDEGLPFNRQGRVTQIVSYPSNVFISIDGEDGYSCVMQFNQSGWHEIYRAPNAGEEIKDMAFQPIYGKRPDRLWIQVGDDVIWLAMPSKILYAIQDPNAEYTHESVLVSSWLTAGMTDVEKLWESLKIMADYLKEDECWVEADYQVDEETVWHPIENLYITSPSQKEHFSEITSVNGKKLRYRLRLQTTDYHKTPKVNVVVIEAVGRVDIKQSYTFYFRNIKYKRDLVGEFEDVEPLEVQNMLDDWANRLRKLRLNSRWKIYDDKIVYLDAVQTSVLNELSEGYIAQISLNEL